MAISSSLALGKVKGSMGGMTYSIVEGRTIVRQTPTHVRNPRTEAQQLQRGKLANAVRAYQQIGPMCAKSFTSRKKYSSQYNEFVARNITASNSFHYDPDNNTLEFNAGVVLGNGSVPNSSIKFEYIEEGGCKLFADSDSLKALLKVGDTLGIYIYDAALLVFEDMYVTLSSDDVTALRNDEGITFPDSVEGFDAGAPYWISADKRKSNSPTLENKMKL